MKTNQSDPSNVIVKGALALSPQNDLLLKGLEYFFEAVNFPDGFFNQGGLSSFFS
jgi:hypothetical protein